MFLLLLIIIIISIIIIIIIIIIITITITIIEKDLTVRNSVTSKVKGKGQPCTGTEALYRLYGP